MLASIRAHDTEADPFEVEAEDELPYVQLGHWMGLADVHAKAKELYWILAMHLNYKRGDRYVWPSTEILALLLGYSRGDKITSFTRELEGIGALKVIKVPDGRGPQMKNVYKLRRTPPEGYTGPRSLSEFYERLGKAYDGAVLEELQRLNSIESPGQTVPPQIGGGVFPRSGGHVGPQLRGDVAPQLGAVTTRTSNYKKENEPAPSARSAGDARRASTGSSARARGGSAAANSAKAPKKSALPKKNQVRMTRDQAKAVTTVEERYPAELAQKMPQYRPPVVRDTILGLLGQAPHQRTAEQLAQRLERRWYRWGFAEKDRKGEINSYPGVVAQLLSAQPCGAPRCEDGTDIDDDEPCRACLERQDERRSQHSGVPSSRTNRRPKPGGALCYWECAEPDCRQPGWGEPSADGLCPACRTRAAEAADAGRRLAAQLAQEEEDRQAQTARAWADLLTQAYEEHEHRSRNEAERLAHDAAKARASTAEAEQDRLLREQLAEEHPELARYSQRM
ncbi:hypothetical protein [Streptomyces sp. NPDC097610]|uniref:hypothetical protein n=1 Tax=Streptomyces sp. NPDC097610 TaxID=3157227 RepID=UPI00332F9835